MSKSKTPTRTDYRDSVDGQFVTKREAETRPRETTKEKNPLLDFPRKSGGLF